MHSMARLWILDPHGANHTIHLQGQLHAVWSHCVSDREVETLKAAKIPMLVIHGRHDILAAPKHGERLAQR